MDPGTEKCHPCNTFRSQLITVIIIFIIIDIDIGVLQDVGWQVDLGQLYDAAIVTGWLL